MIATVDQSIPPLNSTPQVHPDPPQHFPFCRDFRPKRPPRPPKPPLTPLLLENSIHRAPIRYAPVVQSA